MTELIERSDTQAARELAPGAVVVVDCPSGTYRVLNESGSYLWGLLDNKKTMEELSSALCERYGITPEAAILDARMFVQVLGERGMVKVNP